MPTLHLICGLPGCGKSTLAIQLEQEHHALRLTPDEWMARIVGDGYDEAKRAVVEEIQWEIAKRVLSLGVDVVLESGFWSRRERDDFRARAAALGAKAKVHYFGRVARRAVQTSRAAQCGAAARYVSCGWRAY